MRLVQFGIGSWGQSWLDVVDASRRWELAGVVANSFDKANEAAAQRGVKAYRGVEHALEQRGDFDAALIVTPPDQHARIAIEFLEQGIPVLIEKPLAPTLGEARLVVAASESTGAVAMVSQNYRFKRAPRTVRRLIADGVIGEVQQVFVRFQKNPPFEGFRLKMDEPLIVDGMAHQLDQVRGVVGLTPTVVRARSWNPAWSQFAGNASVSLDVECEGNARLIYAASWSSHGPQTSWDGEWDIQGSKGAIEWKNNEVTVRFTSLFDTVFMPGAMECEGVMKVTLDNLTVEERLGVLEEFERAITESDRPETDVRDNISSLQLVLATLESAQNGGRPVELADPAALIGAAMPLSKINPVNRITQ